MLSINVTTDKQFFIQVKARNHEILMSGEPLKLKSSAKKQALAIYKAVTGEHAPTNYGVIDNTKEPREIIYI